MNAGDRGRVVALDAGVVDRNKSGHDGRVWYKPAARAILAPLFGAISAE